MLDDDFEIEVKTFNDILVLAKDALVEADYSESEQKYSQALSKARELFPPVSSEVAACLQGLGDSYCAENRYEEAQEIFLELVGLQEKLEQESKADQKDYAGALFRLAKTQTELRDFKAADISFLKTVDRAESAVEEGHPLITSIYDAYANMLKLADVDMQREVHYREKAKVSRAKFKPPVNKPRLSSTMQNMAASRKAEKPPEIPWLDDTVIADAATEVAQKNVRWLARHPIVTFIIILAVPIVVVATELSRSLAPTINELKGVSQRVGNVLVLPNETYLSPDVKQELKISSSTTAEATMYKEQVSLKYATPRPGWSEIIALYLFSHPQDQWLQKRPGNITTGAINDGDAILVQFDPQHVSLAHRMWLLADAYDRYRKAKGSFPDDVALLSAFEPKLSSESGLKKAVTDIKTVDIPWRTFIRGLSGVKIAPNVGPNQVGAFFLHNDPAYGDVIAVYGTDSKGHMITRQATQAPPPFTESDSNTGDSNHWVLFTNGNGINTDGFDARQPKTVIDPRSQQLVIYQFTRLEVVTFWLSVAVAIFCGAGLVLASYMHWLGEQEDTPMLEGWSGRRYLQAKVVISNYWVYNLGMVYFFFLMFVIFSWIHHFSYVP